jgi:hypothetical protein
MAPAGLDAEADGDDGENRERQQKGRAANDARRRR